ncbi:MAG: long-chain fatty acid--CoA ligase [Acidobacteria bacterium]|nr:long-chain fatty acid--CoA ligase [Acidobacteriota bacterium]
MNAVWHRFYEEGVPTTIEYPDDSLPQLLDKGASEFPEKIALRFFVNPSLPSTTMTFTELRERTRRFATALDALGVKKGDRVAIMLPNSPAYVVAFYGALRIGAVVVNTNPLYVSREMKHQFADSGSETVVLLNTFMPRLEEIWSDTPVKNVIVVDIAGDMAWPFRMLVHYAQKKQGEYVRVQRSERVHFFEELLDRYPPIPPTVAIDKHDVALFQYTGGTTGTPKAAMLTHFNLVANALQIAAWVHKGERGKEKLMAAIPFFHVYGMTTCMIYGLSQGFEVVMIPRPRPVDIVMKVLQKTRCTIFPGVPTLYTAINNHPDVQKYDLSSIKACISGAAPLPVEVQETFERLTGGRLIEGYGLTEAAPVTHGNPFFGKRKIGSIGVPFPDVEAKIVDSETRKELGVGEEGELIIRGPQLMKGYWNRPEETAETIRGEWLYTGDMAKMDEDGFFYIVDRKKDMIIASGFKVLPREVEEVLYTYPAVQEAVVAGVPDPYRGETPKAYVVLKAGQQATAEQIIAHCRSNLAAYKVPSSVEFRAELPKTMVGKILRRVLVEEEQKKLAGKPDAGNA